MRNAEPCGCCSQKETLLKTLTVVCLDYINAFGSGQQFYFMLVLVLHLWSLKPYLPLMKQKKLFDIKKKNSVSINCHACSSRHVQGFLCSIYRLNIYPYLQRSLYDAQATAKLVLQSVSAQSCPFFMLHIHAELLRICRVLLSNFAHYS